MAKRKRNNSTSSSPRRKKSFFKLNQKQKRDILIVVFFGLSCILLLSTINLAGRLGEFLKEYLKYGLGYQAYIIPFISFGICLFLFKEGREKPKKVKIEEGDEEGEEGESRRVYKYNNRWTRLMGLFLFVISSSSLLHLLYASDQAHQAASEGRGGGYLGLGFTYPFQALMGFWATLFLFLTLFTVSLILIFNLSFSGILKSLLSIKDNIILLLGKIKSKMLLDKKLEITGLSMKGGANDMEEESDENIDEFTLGNKKQPNLDLKTKKLSGDDEEVSTEVTKKPSNWKPYTTDLLDKQTSLPTSGNINKNVDVIKSTFENFGIDVSMEGVNIGPTVTQYTLRPAEGVKLSKIIALQNDLSLALASHPIRIEAPIPGKSLVGIEVPNQNVAIVRFKEMLESDDFGNRKSSLSMPLGRDVAGKAVVADLLKMPHLLISGATGSGKSICLNSIILSFLYQNSPDEVKFILVDPKKVEMTSYNGIPHLLTPVVTEVDKTINSLKWLVAEMERRLKLFSERGSRDIASYNRGLRDKKLPYIILIIDELADLMAVAANDVEACIVRLAQMSRAAGIHLILATQRPSVNVITGLIKANIISRIAFAVASQIDSRTILDMSGAEKLLGNGDMLYIDSEVGKPKRIQGMYVSEKEIRNITGYIKEQGEPEYKEEILEKKTSSSIPGMSGDDVEDELYGDAKTIIMQAGKASASFLQRRLRIGYARAARILDILEAQGIVGPANGAKPREILVDNFNQENQNKDENTE
ncbi:MAG: DNA translocase FtsK 4TM domain-containing protein [Parcubacteria group bacterium]|nr:DNA translocase FtsK 4TM domain-containing protein [Parcubacteria group bacterium]